ncbi:MAG: hypothetical protein WBC04_17105 [Candidatus Acidiferrales bacterium]
MRKNRVIHGFSIQEGNGNVYADLGDASSEDMLVKTQLRANRVRFC